MRSLRTGVLPFFLLLCVSIAGLAPRCNAQDSPAFEIKEGDRVLFLGDTLLEREGTYGYLETRMHQQFPDRKFTVRNLSYSADTPHGISRSVFDPADKGWERLNEQIALVKPTVVFLGYGMASSLDFAGSPTDRMAEPKLTTDQKVDRFRKELTELMTAISDAATKGGWSPDAPTSFRSAGGVNDRASLNGTAVRGVPNAQEKSAASTSAEVAIASTKPNPRDEAGGRKGADVVVAPPGVRFVLLSPIRHEDLRSTNPALPDPAEHNKTLDAINKTIAEIAKERSAQFVAAFDPNGPQWVSFSGTVQAVGGNSKNVAAPTATQNGIHLTEQGYQSLAHYVGEALGWKAHIDNVADATFTSKQSAVLRRAIQRKNDLFFHRWRPENQTYLFGFRKHEQGQNAKEIPMFDPLIDQAEAEIDRLKRDAQTTAQVTASAVNGPGTSPQIAVVSPILPAPGAAGNALSEVPPLPLPKFDVQDGYEITLWASNPLLEKPIQMNWDSEGRLWVASSRTYPQIAPGAVEEDRVLILEDTDHDGKADKSTVFTEGLLIPTGVMPESVALIEGAKGGLRSSAYVSASTELLRLTDSDGDGKADQREIVLSGFGTEDTHHILHTLRWAPDGRLYFNQSVYIHSHIETPWGVVRQNSGGIFAWDPRSQRLEVMYNGIWNPWGTAWDKWGQAFFTDGAGFEAINWGIRGAAYQTYEGSRRLLQSISPGSYPKFAGLELIQSPHFPADWQGSAVTCDFRAHRVVHFGIEDLGAANSGAAPSSGYVTKELPDIVRTSDVTFRPIDVKLGPDGALYIADWSNPVINHGEVDFRDPRRDKTHGRIWRVTRKGAQLAAVRRLAAQSPADLLEAARSPNKWSKDWALLRLREQYSPAAATSIDSVKENAKVNETVPPGKTSAADDEILKLYLERLLESPTKDSAAVYRTLVASSTADERAAAMQLVSKSLLRLREGRAGNAGGSSMELKGGSEAESTLFELLKTGSRDTHPRVRLEAMRALSQLSSASSAESVLEAAVMAPANDPFYDYAAWLSINDLAEPWSKAVLSGEWKIDSAGREKQLQVALNALAPEKAAPVLAKLIDTRGIPRNGAGPWLELIGKAGGPKELRMLVDQLASGGFDGPAETRVLLALADAAKLRNINPEGDLQGALQNFASPKMADSARRAAALRLLGLWKVASAFDTVASAATDAKAPAEVRNAAIEALRDIDGKDALSFLGVLVRPDQPLEIRRVALGAIAQVKLDAAIVQAADVLAASPNEDQALATWRTLLGVKGAADALAVRLPRELPQAAITAGVRAAREQGKRAEKLAAALAPLAGVSAQAAKPTQNYAAVAELVKRDGDPARGEEIYRRAQLGCVTCHAIGGAGGKVGPELTSLGASAPLDYIIESVLNPAAKVKEGFNAINITLKDGTVASGIQSRETATEIFLRNVTGQEAPVVKGNIATKENIGSIMPAGLVEQLAPREQQDLFAFLAQLGKPGVYDASKGTVARVWKLVPGTELEKVLTGAADLSSAASAYTNVDGQLSRERLTNTLQFIPAAADTVLTIARFQLPAKGTAHFTLAGVSKAWLDGNALAVASEPTVTVDLPAGEHTLTVKLDPKQLPSTLRAESADVRFLTD